MNKYVVLLLAMSIWVATSTAAWFGLSQMKVLKEYSVLGGGSSPTQLAGEQAAVYGTFANGILIASALALTSVIAVLLANPTTRPPTDSPGAS